jgi:hypothetical protein
MRPPYYFFFSWKLNCLFEYGQPAVRPLIIRSTLVPGALNISSPCNLARSHGNSTPSPLARRSPVFDLESRRLQRTDACDLKLNNKAATYGPLPHESGATSDTASPTYANKNSDGKSSPGLRQSSRSSARWYCSKCANADSERLLDPRQRRKTKERGSGARAALSCRREGNAEGEHRRVIRLRIEESLKEIEWTARFPWY